MKTLKLQIKRAALLLLLAGTLLLPATAFAADSCQTSGSPSVKDQKTATSAELQKCLTDNPITKKLNLIVNFLSAAVGVVVIGVIIVGGIQYTLAGDNPTATGAAKQRIVNGLIALATFIFTYAFLQWLIPGGL